MRKTNWQRPELLKGVRVTDYDGFREQGARTAEKRPPWTPEQHMELAQLTIDQAKPTEVNAFAGRIGRNTHAVLGRQKAIKSVLNGGQLVAKARLAEKIREDIRPLLDARKHERDQR